jgi:ADP-ribose pyrophosphatase
VTDTARKTVGLPAISVEKLGDLSPAVTGGFLELRRYSLRVRYPDASLSEPLTYDFVDRRALDAVAIAAHYERDGQRHVYLRSAVRPPIAFRDPEKSPVSETGSPGLWELPAGLIEAGERTSLEGVMRCARRELMEELGFDVDLPALRELGPNGFVSPGVLGERIFFAEVRVIPEERQEPTLDGSPLEHFGAVVDVTLEQALDMCRAGEICDFKTELGLRRLGELLR